MPDRSIDVLRREMLAVLNRAEQATAWEHRARGAEAAVRELAHHPEDAALVDDMAALLRSLRHPLTASDGRPPEQDVARIDALLERCDAATRKQYGGS